LIYHNTLHWFENNTQNGDGAKISQFYLIFYPQDKNYYSHFTQVWINLDYNTVINLLSAIDAYMCSMKANVWTMSAYMRLIKVTSMDAYMRLSIFSISHVLQSQLSVYEMNTLGSLATAIKKMKIHISTISCNVVSWDIFSHIAYSSVASMPYSCETYKSSRRSYFYKNYIKNF